MKNLSQISKTAKSFQNTVQPKISIIICIYNVEPYLRECLDSVVNQTLRDIQIICVNDGSPDNSRAILQEYADRDPRIEIFDQENQGLGIARNNALTHARGRYIYFVDPDDVIEHDLCRILYWYAEAQCADAVFLLRDTINFPEYQIAPSLVYSKPVTVKYRKELLRMKTGACDKFCLNEFLKTHDIRFSHHRRTQDAIYHWKTCLHCTRPAILPVVLYHQRPVDSPQGTGKWKHVHCVADVYSLIKETLESEGVFDDYHEEFYMTQFENIYGACSKMSPESFGIFQSQMLSQLDEHALNFIMTNQRIPPTIRDFLLELSGNRYKTPERSITKLQDIWCNINNSLFRPVLKPVEAMIRYITGKEKKQEHLLLDHILLKQQKMHDQQIALLRDLVNQLCQEIVELRSEVMSVNTMNIDVKKVASMNVTPQNHDHSPC